MKSNLTTFFGFTREAALSEEKSFAPMTYWDADFAVALRISERFTQSNEPACYTHSCCFGGVVRPTGFEPVAFRSGGERSIRLSYGRKQITGIISNLVYRVLKH